MDSMQQRDWQQSLANIRSVIDGTTLTERVQNEATFFMTCRNPYIPASAEQFKIEHASGQILNENAKRFKAHLESKGIPYREEYKNYLN